MEQIVNEIEALHQDFEEETPELRGRAAAAQFMGSLYLGIENILKRILKFRGEEPPSGERWHVELFDRFCHPSDPSVPTLFENEWIERTDSFRRFRHVVRHGYALDLEWERMRVGMKEARPVFEHFRRQVAQFLARLGEGR